MIESINFKKEIALGTAIGFIFIILNATFGLVLGLPLLAFSSDTERYVVQDGIAPIAEELGFRAVLPFVLFMLGIPLIVNAAINIIAFPAFHYFAYGGSFVSASSLFVGAGLFALVAFLATYYDSDVSEFHIPISTIIAHSIINTWLGIKMLGLIFTGGFT